MKLRILILLLGVAFFSRPILAEDVYNFYFQKSPGKKQEENTKEVEEVSDDLAIPENWQPAKKSYVKKSNKVKTKADEINRRKRKDRGWGAKLGLGSMATSSHYNTPFGMVGLDQKTYVLGTTFHISRYFEVNSELLLPNGDAEEKSGLTYFGGNYNMDPQFSLGMGVTPIHLNIFGGELFAIGFDGGITVGNKDSFTGSTTRIYLGPRIEMNFNRHWGLMYTYRDAIDTEGDFDMQSLSVAYRW